MDTINFELKGNRKDVLNFLIEKGYAKIGHIKANCKGFCIMINRKQFFEISSFRNPNIYVTSNVSDLILNCA